MRQSRISNTGRSPSRLEQLKLSAQISMKLVRPQSAGQTRTRRRNQNASMGQSGAAIQEKYLAEMAAAYSHHHSHSQRPNESLRSVMCMLSPSKYILDDPLSLGMQIYNHEKSQQNYIQKARPKSAHRGSGAYTYTAGSRHVGSVPALRGAYRGDVYAERKLSRERQRR